MSQWVDIHSCSALISIFILVLCCLSARLEAKLKVGFYDQSCPQAESIVKEEVMKEFSTNRWAAPGLVRMHFHDCFVRGCDASVLIDSTPTNKAEKEAFPTNDSLRGFEVIDRAKARLEAIPTCARVVSCADILAFAARDSVEITGGLGYNVPAGRRDGDISLALEAVNSLPPSYYDVNQLTQNFVEKNLTQDDLVILSGAHTIGQSHCSSFDWRLFNFTGTKKPDPGMDSTLVSELRQVCPEVASDVPVSEVPDPVLPMDPPSPLTSDVGYYKNILANRALFTSDQTLLNDNSKTAQRVRQFAKNKKLWQKEFADAMVRLGNVEVLTGTAGEIRLNCRVVNPKNGYYVELGSPKENNQGFFHQ